MSIHDATIAMLDALNELNIDYLLVGSLAASFYGLSRATTDADFVLQLKDRRLQEVVQRLGAGFELDPQPRFEVFTQKRVETIYVVGTIFKIDVFPLSNDPFDQLRFKRRIRARLQNRDVVLPTAEDVVVMKIRWQRALDLEDAKYVMSLQASLLDWQYIEHWCEVHGTRTTLDQLRNEVRRPS
jgi:hypothetical protein